MLDKATFFSPLCKVLPGCSWLVLPQTNPANTYKRKEPSRTTSSRPTGFCILIGKSREWWKKKEKSWLYLAREKPRGWATHPKLPSRKVDST